MDSRTTWSLHPQLEHNTDSVADLPLSQLLVMKDSNYPWLILVPRRAGVVELTDLDEAAQGQLMREIAATGRALKNVTACDKLNIATLGNIVPQLHVHVIARRRSDAAWPRPVWGAMPALSYDEGELCRFIADVRRTLAKGLETE